MTDFAQRLVARSAGRPVGLPLLTPRPASRFERSESQALEEATETTAPAVAKPVADPAPDHIHVPATPWPQERRAEPAEPETIDVHDGLPARAPRQAKAPVAGRTDAADRPPPMLASRSSQPAGIEASHQEASTAASGRVSVARMTEASPELGDQAEAAHFPPVIARPDVAKAGQALAPAISIGRIEVQFLAPEKPAAAPRPEPQRTRGFDAYARARRGMPR